jgi:hypothetical protein
MISDLILEILQAEEQLEEKTRIILKAKKYVKDPLGIKGVKSAKDHYIRAQVRYKNYLKKMKDYKEKSKKNKPYRPLHAPLYRDYYGRMIRARDHLSKVKKRALKRTAVAATAVAGGGYGARRATDPERRKK